ncbi:MAG TPA: 2-amino-4-hydroxy-6-hydroxymethyldihydropteridine diphosphokinase [Gemmatimonadaceae bacterium]|nr:2-amino-4-hydroxy-6-hydroxymethyldihydropteridine diphosphokinase [Gemmatimonadaceae bacterium]
MRDVAYIALGSNIGDRVSYLAHARAALEQLPRSRIVGTSEIEETAALGPIEQDPFLNQMIALETELAPADLLRHLHEIERIEGRVRGARWGPRTLDLDIVRFGSQVVDTPDLQVPHRELPNRMFWQRELAELTAK